MVEGIPQVIRRAVLILALLLTGVPGVAHAGVADQVATCADHHPWEKVAEREPLIWCVAHVLDAPGSPSKAVAVAHCESGSDLQDTYAGDGYVGTYQQDVDRWADRWQLWGEEMGVPSGATNVLSQTVVSVRMAIALGTWDSTAGWAGCA